MAKNKKRWWDKRAKSLKQKKAEEGDILGVGINKLVAYVDTCKASTLLRAVVEVASTDEPSTVQTPQGDCSVLRITRPPSDSWDGDEDDIPATAHTPDGGYYPEWHIELPDSYSFILSLQHDNDRTALVDPTHPDHLRMKKLRFEMYDTTERFDTALDLAETLSSFVPDINVRELQIGTVSFYFDVVGAEAAKDITANQDPAALLRKRLASFLGPLTSN